MRESRERNGSRLRAGIPGLPSGGSARLSGVRPAAHGLSGLDLKKQMAEAGLEALIVVLQGRRC